MVVWSSSGVYVWWVHWGVIDGFSWRGSSADHYVLLTRASIFRFWCSSWGVWLVDILQYRLAYLYYPHLGDVEYIFA